MGQFQSSVQNVPNATIGDFALGFGITSVYNTLARRVQDSAGINIGTFCFYLATDNNFLVQAKGTNTVLAGFVFRDNSNTWNQAITVPANLNIANGSNIAIATRGAFWTTLTEVVGAGTTATFGDVVYVNDTDGTIVTGVTVETGYTKTNWKVASQSTAIGGLMIITNTDEVEGV